MEKKLNSYSVIVQARLSSARLPSKVLISVQGKKIIELIIERLKKSKLIDKIIIAIPKNQQNNKLKVFLKKKNIIIFSGSEKNVLKRYYEAAKKYKIKNIIRITADCPFVDSQIIDKMIKYFDKNKFEYLTNRIDANFPDGLDIEIFKFKTLQKVNKIAKKKDHKEHVTQFIYENEKMFKIGKYKYYEDFSHLRLTLDEVFDLKIIKFIYNHFKPSIYFNLDDIIKLYRKNKDRFKSTHS